ncbi:hypothetical protein [Geothrix oryzisoli]|uniref:hypothetical protein n=1 Tax=Geothrix oryzisoli TaxID=2922721 RepID=UPI001FAD8DD3|nr:hypothetical protein [Geothrix oryzisoli]
MAFDSNVQWIRMQPPPGCNFADLPGVRYYGGPQSQGVAPEHVAALEAQGWCKVDRPPVPPPSPEALRAERAALERAALRPLSAPHKRARVLPPLSGAFTTMTIEGRTYASRTGAPIDVPVEDARVLVCNSWLLLGACGPLEARSEQPQIGEAFFENSTDRQLIFDGRRWRDTRTGAEV